MTREQTKRLYRLIAGIVVVAFLIFGFRTVDDFWDGILGDRLTERFHSNLREHEIMTNRPDWNCIAASLTLLRDHKSITDEDYEQSLDVAGQTLEQEFRQSQHTNTRLHRAWQFMSVYQDWSWTLTFGSMVLLSAFAYRFLWFFCDRSIRYVRDGSEVRPNDTKEEEEPNKTWMGNPH
jgi:hypothetical protein